MQPPAAVRRGIGGTLVAVLALAGTRLLPTAAAGDPTVARDGEGLRVTLTDGRLYVPPGYRPPKKGAMLTLHLHGDTAVVEREFRKSGLPGVLYNVTLNGLSSVYAERFRDSEILRRILEESRARLPGERPPIRDVCVSSFSAGYGGVRELLRRESDWRRMDAVVLLDSLYAGYERGATAGRPEPDHMAPFERYASQAVRKRRRMLITHSRVRPEGYASTVETADALMVRFEIVARPRDREMEGGLRLYRRGRKGWLEILGFAGQTGEDHMAHLRSMGQFLRRGWNQVVEPD